MSNNVKTVGWISQEKDEFSKKNHLQQD
jgi:hypothetical protein